MAIWKQEAGLEGINQIGQNTMVHHLDIQFTAIGEDYLEAKMPVNKNTVQPQRLLHGGASVALAETVGSVASFLCLDNITKQTAVGLEINANHLRSVLDGGEVKARCIPVKIGRTIHVWQIDIRDTNNNKLVCTSRLTMAIKNR